MENQMRDRKLKIKVHKHTKIIEVECWNCGIESHTHKTEDIALRCVEKQRKGPKKNVRDRNCEITLRVLRGDTYANVASEYGLSIPAVREAFRYVVRHTLKIERVLPEGLSGIRSNCYSVSDYRKNSSYFVDLVIHLRLYWRTGSLPISLKLESSIERLDLNFRTLSVLRCEGVETILDLVERSECSLLANHCLGKKYVEQIKTALKHHGFELTNKDQ